MLPAAEPGELICAGCIGGGGGPRSGDRCPLNRGVGLIGHHPRDGAGQ